MSTSRQAYRPFRAAAYVLFIAVATVLTGLVLLSVVRGLVAEARVEPPPRDPIVRSAPEESITREEAKACLEAFESLHLEIEEGFARLPSLAATMGRDTLRQWTDEVRLWEAARSSIAEECRLSEPSGGPVAEALLPVANALDRLLRALSTHATRMVLEDAHTFEGVSTAFEETREKIRAYR